MKISKTGIFAPIGKDDHKLNISIKIAFDIKNCAVSCYHVFIGYPWHRDRLFKHFVEPSHVNFFHRSAELKGTTDL